MLWSYRAEPGGSKPRLDGRWFADLAVPGRRLARLTGTPVFADCDRDGVPDLIMAMHTFLVTRQDTARPLTTPTVTNADGNELMPPAQVVVAVSGRTGGRLWSHPIDRPVLDFPAEPWSDEHLTLMRGPRSSLIGIVHGTQWIGLDLETGRKAGEAIDIGFEPLQAVQYADLDGDGEPEVLAAGPGPAARLGRPGAGQQTLAAFSRSTGRELWAETIGSPFEQPETAPNPDLPLIVDLDGDGRVEIVVPDSGAIAPAVDYRGVRMLDGASGKARWVRPIRPETEVEDYVEHVISAPDLDGDGTRDLVTFSRFEGRYAVADSRPGPIEPRWIYVDTLSGRDGHALWWWRTRIEDYRDTRVWKPHWWGRGPDGWPLLAVTLADSEANGMVRADRRTRVVHVLEASSGREVHTIDGLLHPDVADFDGDGLADLWGEADLQLRAFRGQPPEAWRALGSFKFARPPSSMGPPADLDGDGIGDTLSGAQHAPAANAADGGPTVVSRSGRDGHVLWKSSISPPRGWADDFSGDSFDNEVFPSPAGDFDGDGIPDVLVKKYGDPQENDRAATLPLDLLSGRTGKHLWRAGPLPLHGDSLGYSRIMRLHAAAIEPQRAGDVLVLHTTAFDKGSGVVGPNDPVECRMARLSGRNGRVVWETLLQAEQDSGWRIQPSAFQDIDGDGSLDVVLLNRLSEPDDRGFELKAVALSDGGLIWSKVISGSGAQRFPQVALGDLDGDHRSEVVVTEDVPAPGNKLDFVLETLDGRDGATLWSFHGGAVADSLRGLRPWLSLPDFDGHGQRRVCLEYCDFNKQGRLIVFDDHGRELARREVSADQPFSQSAADLNGDGRDELLTSSGERVQVLDGTLKEIWSRERAIRPPGRVGLLTSPGLTSTVIVHPMMGLDGADGHPRWAAQFAPQPQMGAQAAVLEPGGPARLPLLISTGNSSVCRWTLATTPQGAYAPAQGNPVKPGLTARNDPRWSRRLPWITGLGVRPAPRKLLAAAGLALLNVVLPLAILRLAARRRPWRMMLLMALPVAAAIPLSALVILEPMLSSAAYPQIPWPKLQFMLETLAGIPVIAFAGALCVCLVRRRRRRQAFGRLAAVTLLASLAVGAGWIWVDMKSMARVEYYGWPDWYLVVVPGVYAAGVSLLIGWAIRSVFGLTRRMRPEQQ